MNRFVGLGMVAVVVLVAVPSASASGFLVVRDAPRIAGVYNVLYQHIDMRIEDQVCKVQVDAAFENPTPRTLEVEYYFPLPVDAVIDNFVLMVDGKELPGRLLGREEARRIYEDIVRRQKDPALLEFMGRGVFKTRVFPIPPGQQRAVHLSFGRVCRREGNLVTVDYPLADARFSAQPIRELHINCRISSSHPIKSAYSPTHHVNVTRPGDRIAEVTLRQQQVLPSGDFQLMYGVSDADIGMSVLSYRPKTSEPGYFLLLSSPKVQVAAGEVLPKSVILVLDKSGSMTGAKIEQAKNALRFVVKNLSPRDTFNIVTYDDDVELFKPELQAVGGAVVDQALQFVDRISAGGSTNIDAALRTALGLLHAPEHPSYIIFLTDGRPTAGETGAPVIVQNCIKANAVRARLMAFGVGDDVNAHLLDKLVSRNHGASHYVRPGEDIEAPVSALFRKLSTPVLSEVTLDFAGLDGKRTYPAPLPDLFQGNQLVVVGRYHQPGPVTVRLRGRVGKEAREFTQAVLLDDQKALYAHSFTEKLWAERRVGVLIDEIDLNGRNPELVDEIVLLSTRYGILTPYTSFLADERTELADAAGNARRARVHLEQLDIDSGSAGVGQRVAKQDYMRTPNLAAPARQGRFAATTDVEGERKVVETVLNVGNKTFYRKQNVWQEGGLTEPQIRTAVTVVQYSPEYFELLARLPAEATQYLSIDGELLLELAGQPYRVVPESDQP